MAGFLKRLFGGAAAEAEDIPVPEVAATDRIYAVGDIHGRDDLLIGLFEKITDDIATASEDRRPLVVFLGDYIDRGDNSRAVVDALMAIEEGLGDGVVFLRGNHEAALLDFIQDPVHASAWLRWGGLQTLASYGLRPPKSPMADRDLEELGQEMRAALGSQAGFLSRTKMMLRSGDVVFCHAGLDPDLPLDGQSEDALLWGRSEFVEAGGVPGLRVVHGHYDGTEVISTPRRICVDTGAYYSGRLTAVRLDAEETILGINALDL